MSTGGHRWLSAEGIGRSLNRRDIDPQYPGGAVKICEGGGMMGARDAASFKNCRSKKLPHEDVFIEKASVV